jgi:hypothetical protein
MEENDKRTCYSGRKISKLKTIHESLARWNGTESQDGRTGNYELNLIKDRPNDGLR